MSHSDETSVNESGNVNVDIFKDLDKGTPLSRTSRILRMLDEYVYAPILVAWNDWRARVGMLIILAFIFTGTIGTQFVPEPAQYTAGQYITPFQNWDYPLGTDQWGNPIDRQIVHATPAMLKMVVAGAVVASGFGALVGIVSGFKGGRVDWLMMTVTDIFLTIPGLPLIIVIAAVYPPRDPFIVGIILAIDNWPGLARSIRSQVLSIRQESYIEAARVLGTPTRGIVGKDIVPQLMPYILINSAGAGRGVIFESVALYFLGILPFTSANWGVMMNQAYGSGALVDPNRAHYLYLPMFAVIVISFGLILLSQGMDRIFNPRLRAKYSKTAGGDDDNVASLD